MIYVGNAPCSWGNLEFQGLDGHLIGFRQLLDELSESGYAGTELGDWGFLPIEPKILHTELATRNLTMTGAFVPIVVDQYDYQFHVFLNTGDDFGG